MYTRDDRLWQVFMMQLARMNMNDIHVILKTYRQNSVEALMNFVFEKFWVPLFNIHV